MMWIESIRGGVFIYMQETMGEDDDVYQDGSKKLKWGYVELN